MPNQYEWFVSNNDDQMEYQFYEDVDELINYNFDESDDESIHRLLFDQPFESSNWSSIIWQFVSCSREILSQSYWQLCFPLLLCLVWRVILIGRTKCLRFLNMKPVFFAILLHATSILAGFVLINHFFENNQIMLFAIISYLTICFAINLRFVCLHDSKFEYLLIVGICLTAQIYCEFFVDAVEWHKVRGSVMIVIMKAISFPSSYQTSLNKESQISNEYSTTTRHHWAYQLLAWVSYALCPASVILGPWFDFTCYERLIWTGSANVNTLISSAIYSIRSLGLALLCLVYSTCGGLALFPQLEFQPWCNAYLVSQSFRFSHYFVSFASESTIAAFGLGPIHVTRPLSIEFARSLVEVVVQWSLPMHSWLKQYVYKPLRPFGQIYAILGTYVASSLLHGLNFQLSAVLLSIGIYAYIEYCLRDKLAGRLNACIGSRSCPNSGCEHKYKNHFLVHCANLGFSALALFHLSYLAVMFDFSEDQIRGYSMKHALNKWADLNFSSHFIALITYLLYRTI